MLIIEVAPVITQYLSRMMQAGYPERYRKDVLQHALNIYDKMVKDDREGSRPLYRPKDWQVEQRMKDKKNKKHSCSSDFCATHT